MSKLRISIIALLLPAFTVLGAAMPAPQPVGEHCADLIAAALTSPSAPIAGAYACQSPDFQATAAAAGIHTDADIESFAQGLGFTAAADTGGEPPAFTYLISGPGLSDEVLIVWVDRKGLVDAFQRVSHP